MTKIYYCRIRAGIMTVEQVPTVWRDAVQALIDSESEQNTSNEGDTP